MIAERIAKELKVRLSQVEATIALIDEGNTIPFIARYRKEATGGLSDIELRDLDERLTYLRNLEDRKQEILRLIDEQGKLTDGLKEEILAAEVLQRLEDLYKPYKQKKSTRASKAREKGLEPLAVIIRAMLLTRPEPRRTRRCRSYAPIRNCSRKGKAQPMCRKRWQAQPTSWRR